MSNPGSGSGVGILGRCLTRAGWHLGIVFPHLQLDTACLCPQVQFLSPQARRRFHAALASCSTSMLILSNLVFLGGSQVGKIYWNRIFIQGKLPNSAVSSQFLLFHECCRYLNGFRGRRSLFCSWYVTLEIPTRNNPCVEL